MRIRSATLALLVGFSAAACGGRSSLVVTNSAATEYLLRIEVERNASFGFVIPPNTAARAWRDEAGSINGWAVLLTPDCQPVGKWRLDPTGGSIEIDASGRVSLRMGSAQPADRWLEYSSACSPPPGGVTP